jgi:uncharacterized protein (TIGR03089 family)
VLTWYSVSQERIELSGPTLLRWVAKTAHLLQLDVDAQPGERLVADLGASWRAPAVWLAAWHLGLTVVLPGGGGGDLAVVADGRGVPDSTDADRLVVVAGPALALRAEHVPAGAVDYAATVSGFPDVPPPPGPAPEPALASAEGELSLAEVLSGGERRRLWLGPQAGPREVVGTWAAGGSVVWHDGLPDAEADRTRADEQAVMAR